MSTTNLAVLYSVITLLSWGIENSLYKTLAKNLSPEKLIFYRNLFTFALTGVALFFFIGSTNFVPNQIAFGALLAGVGFIGYVYLLKALAKGHLAIVSPISSSRILIASAIGHLFLDDKLTSLQFFSIFIIFIGLCLTAFEKKLNRTSIIEITYAALNALIWGIVFPLYSIPSAILGGFLFAFVLESTVLLASLVKLVVERHSLKLTSAEVQLNVKNLALVGIFGGIGSVGLNLGYATGHVGIVSAISASVPLITVPFGLYIYKEKLRLKQIIAVILLLVGIISLAYL